MNNSSFIQDLEEALKSAIIKGTESTIWSGFHGEYWHRYYKALLDLDIARVEDKVTADEYTNLKTMLDSPDRENMTVVEEILKQKTKV